MDPMVNEQKRERGSADQDAGLLDLVVIVAESWRLLIFVPLLVAIITAGILLLLPREYESRALLRLGPAAPLLLSQSVLAPVIERLGLREELAPDLDESIEALADRMWAGPFRDSDLTSVRLRWEDPKQAQVILSEVIKETFQQARPRDGERADLEENLADINAALEQLQEFQQKLSSPAAPVDGGTEAEDYTRAYVLVVTDILNKKLQTTRIERELEGLGAENIIHPPHLPDAPVPGGRAPLVILAAILTGFALLCWVVARASYKAARQNPVTAEKLERIKRAFRLRRPKEA